jgi:hypothetical protein
VYDVENQSFLVRYPALLLVTLALSGLAAFALTGFLGYPDDQPAVARLFQQPWPLFVWLGALLLTLEASIFRHPALRGRLVAMLTTTLAALLLLTLGYFYSVDLRALLAQLLGPTRGSSSSLLDLALGNAWTYTLLDALIVGIFWGDTLRRWMRRGRGRPPHSHEELNAGATARPRGGLPRMEDLISGDLLAGAALALALAALLQPEVIALLGRLAQAQVPITACVVSLPGRCQAPGGGASDPPLLAFVNLVLALVTFTLGLLALGLSAMLSGLGAVGGVDESEMEDPTPLLRDASSTESSTESVSEQVGLTVVNTLRSAVDRRIRQALRHMALSLRTLIWPLLIFGAVVALALMSRALQRYLHSDKSLAAVEQSLLPGMGWGAAALVATIAAVSLFAFSRRVLGNTLRFLALLGLVLLLTFWLFSLGLWSINQLVRDVGLSARQPFATGTATAFSLLALVTYGAVALRAAARRSRLVRARQATARSDAGT